MKIPKHLGAPILSPEQFAKLRPKLKGKIVMTSGGFDPIHPGHISCFQEAKKLGDILVVAVNGDAFLKAKKGKSFQNLDTRAVIISGIRGVDYVVPFEVVGDISAGKALEAVRPHIFANGGNRSNLKMLPRGDVEMLKKYNIKFVSGVGANKQWSSSDFLEQWVAFRNKDKESIRRVREFYRLSYSGVKK